MPRDWVLFGEAGDDGVGTPEVTACTAHFGMILSMPAFVLLLLVGEEEEGEAKVGGGMVDGDDGWVESKRAEETGVYLGK